MRIHSQSGSQSVYGLARPLAAHTENTITRCALMARNLCVAGRPRLFGLVERPVIRCECHFGSCFSAPKEALSALVSNFIPRPDLKIACELSKQGRVRLWCFGSKVLSIPSKDGRQRHRIALFVDMNIHVVENKPTSSVCERLVNVFWREKAHRWARLCSTIERKMDPFILVCVRERSFEPWIIFLEKFLGPRRRGLCICSQNTIFDVVQRVNKPADVVPDTCVEPQTTQHRRRWLVSNSHCMNEERIIYIHKERELFRSRHCTRIDCGEPACDAAIFFKLGACAKS
mmetsp:Transcript_14952/g.32092  ORF Transcript_14952/g.32092 Transcript_14952/m.32092 type:complete len:287 (-) Transcript_14952:493-1353(-)